MKFVTKKNYTLILLLILLCSLSIIKCDSTRGCDSNMLNKINDRYSMPRFNEIDRLRIRFRKDDTYNQFETIEYDGDLDDLDLPNTLHNGEAFEEFERSESTEEDSNSSESSNQENENAEYLYNDQNGSLFVNEGDYSNLSELVIDKYLENAFLKHAIIVKMTRNMQNYAIL